LWVLAGAGGDRYDNPERTPFLRHLHRAPEFERELIAEGTRAEQRQQGARLLTTAATRERGFQAFRGRGNLQVFQSQVNEPGRLHPKRLSDLESFNSALSAQRIEPKASGYVNDVFGHLAERIKALAG
jgi:hypothetical protein